MTEEKNPYGRKKEKSELEYTWFELMWKNSYIQLFIVAIAFLSAVLYYQFFSDEPFYSLGGFLIGLAIPIGMMTLIGYYGFYKFWNDYTHGKSR